ncbi:MAG TPA: CPBP family intramembrane glutamic endopeptidase [Gemmatimonadaceae bacterium]|nr:CPBP family intramembrane glutamic endopeptidase [Gemmatimonadaceae bacterium]
MRDVERVAWRSVVVFYLLACALSWPFYWWRDMHPASWNSWALFSIPASSPLTFIIKNAVVMWGPGIAAIITLTVFRDRHPRTISLFGRSRARSLLFYWVPIFIAAIVGMPLPNGSVNRAAVLGLGLVTMFTVMGEELGWRGFLQDALRPLAPWKRYVLIGVMWEFWHFTNRTSHGSLSQRLTMLAIFYPVGILLSSIFGEATDRGRALLIAITLHAWFDIVFTFPGERTYLALALSIPVWIAILWTWKPEEATELSGKNL